MGRIIDAKPGESVYDPACGTGGMPLECINHLKENKQETPITAKPTSKEKPKEANTKKELKKQISDIEKEQLVDKEFEIRLAINELLSRK